MGRDTVSLKAYKAKAALTVRQQNESRHYMMREVTNLSKKLLDCAKTNPTETDYQKKIMTSAQIKAAELILNRTVPVLSAIPMLNEDDAENHSREELQAKIKNMVENNPMLAIMAGLAPKVIDDDTD